MMDVHVIEASWPGQRDHLREVRRNVFVIEQDIPESLEWDGLDDDATHFLALDSAGRAIGCARLLPTGQIGRMAVLASHRGMGIGARLLTAAVTKARELGFNEVFLHAQSHALPFYARAGFAAEGEEFIEAGIPHRNMIQLLAIAPSESLRNAAARPAEAPVIDTPPRAARITLFSGEALARDALAAGLALARRELIIYSHDLDPLWFDAPQIADAISSFARRAPATRVRMLIQSSEAIVGRGHRLVHLARRLSSKVFIRLVDPDFDPPDSCHVAWDEKGFWLLPDRREPRGSLHADDPVPARRLFDAFAILWEHGRSDPELRELHL